MYYKMHRASFPHQKQASSDRSAIPANFIFSYHHAPPPLWDHGGERNRHNFYVSWPIWLKFCMEAYLAPRTRLNKYDTFIFIFGQRPLGDNGPLRLADRFFSYFKHNIGDWRKELPIYLNSKIVSFTHRTAPVTMKWTSIYMGHSSHLHTDTHGTY